MIERIFVKAKMMKQCAICQIPTQNCIRRRKEDKESPTGYTYTGMPVFVCNGCMQTIHDAYETDVLKPAEPELPFTDENVLIEPENAENSVSPEASSEEKTGIPSFENILIEGENPAEMKFFKLKEYARQKGVEVTNSMTKVEILADLKKLEA